MPDIEVAGIEVGCRQRLQMRLFDNEALRRRLPELAKIAHVSDICHPLFQELIDVGKAVEPPVAYKEVFLEVFHHPLNLTFGTGPARAARPRQEAIVVGKQQEACVEHHVAVTVFQHGSFLVIDKHGFHAAAKITEGAHQRLVRVLSVLFWRGKTWKRRENPSVLTAKFTLHRCPATSTSTSPQSCCSW